MEEIRLAVFEGSLLSTSRRITQVYKFRQFRHFQFPLDGTKCDILSIDFFTFENLLIEIFMEEQLPVVLE